ncbi:hypothetical protein SAMN06265222_11648 [Neorhodopirellula lusitana]|uniref:Myosin heavy chain, neuronal-like protein n=1 Tax=Neorhodopirellula lusitana TaxID=445327 RepID=A0ABY1QJD2_9BACT|nr:hypothetical protein [Neorhodopirellula lusitana]SMP73192.1 hypothetical protein SAMN06265222_11648 [Neorhodopirellula lusitana]
MHYALLGFLILLVIAQAVLLWKAKDSWRWHQMIAIITVTILGVVFVFPLAGALKSRSAWHKVKKDLDAQLAQVQAEQLELRYGDPNSPLAQDGVLAMAQRLSKLGTEAGRRWRGLRLTNQNFGDQPSIVLTQPSQATGAEGVPEDAAEDGADGEDNPVAQQPLIPEGMVVYGFGEGQQPGLDQMIPVFYLGEFRVTASTPNQITLTTTGPLLPRQQQAITSGQASSWSIYELLPLDGHEPFIAEGSVPDDDNVFGRVDDELINRLLGKTSDEARQRYLRDGSRSQPDDRPLTRWVKVEFTKPHTIVVDSPDQRGALDGGYFDGSGRAVDSRLQAGAEGKVKFAKGDLLVVKEEAASALQQEGVARLVDTYYLRSLNDYRFVLRRIRLRLAELSTRTEELNFERDILQRAVDATVKMLGEYQTDKLKLEQDLAQTETERKAIEDYNLGLRETVAGMKKDLVRLYRSNQSLEGELEQFHFSIESNMDSLTSTR